MLAINDPAGAAGALCRAINALTPHSCRLVTRETRYNFDYPADLFIPPDTREGAPVVEAARQALAEADILHFHMTADEDTPFGPLTARPWLPGRIVVHHHHGHPEYRADPEPFRRKYRERGRRDILVSTPDLLRLFPEARWQPNLVPTADPAYLPADPPPPGPPEAPWRVAHSPTRRDLKNTAEFLRVVDGLKADPTAPAVAAEVIEMTPHHLCLARKRACQALFDHMQGYYGVSSLEALSMGLPVLVGLDAFNLGHIRAFAEESGETGGGGDIRTAGEVGRIAWRGMDGTGLTRRSGLADRTGLAGSSKGIGRIGETGAPFVVVRDANELSRAIRVLAADPDLCREIGRLSRAFMTGPWREDRVVARLIAFYERAG